MTTKVKTLGDRVVLLPPSDRTYLTERLLASLDDTELERRWLAEAQRRRDEVRSGRVKPIPADEVYQKIDRILEACPHRGCHAWQA